MICFELQKIFKNLNHNDICVELNFDESNFTFLNKKLRDFLDHSKKNIDNYVELWDSMKKYTNHYEFIHTLIPEYNVCISKYIPLSRAFYKMIEIINFFNINSEQKINSFHLAEAPGGFMEALCFLRQGKHNEKYTGISLQNDDKTTPFWKLDSSLFTKYKNKIEIENGLSGDGNLYKSMNFLYLKNKYGNSMNLITADGGFDFSLDYNQQEKNMLRLLFTEICYALILQEQGGTFILKIFDIFLEQTAELLYILSLCYENVYIMKPSTSRSANSEKYVICKNFKNEININLVSSLFFYLQKLEKCPKMCISSILFNANIPSNYFNQIREINTIIGQNQLETINSTIMIIEQQSKKKERLQQYIKDNISKCVEWCIENNIEYRKNLEKENVFIKT
jgi:23S rRNA U2552 (ribose-2'-O)-methylase RlmE/FtsJ